MTRHPIAAALALAGLAGTAAAQSGVTIGGIADSAARVVSNEGRGSVKSVVSGSNSTSRLIVRGTEDLAGGLYAGFHLEHGILLDAGAPAQATQFWDRRATVSLVDATWGELRAGRDFVPSYVSWSRFDPFSYVGAASSSNLVSATPNGPIRAAFGATNPNTTVRASNAVQVLLPGGLGGLEGGVLIAAGEGGTAANGQHKVQGLRLGYVAGALNLSAALTRSQNDLTTARGALKDAALGGSVDFGAARVSLAWRRFEQAGAKQTNLLLGAWIPVGAGEVKLSWNRVDLSGSIGAVNLDANDARQVGLGYVHNLSRRTALYATVSRIGNQGGATYTVPGGAAGLAGGGRSSGAEFGFRHSF